MDFKDDKFFSKQLEPYHNGDQQNQKSSREEEYFDPNLSKKKKIVFWIYLIALVCFIAAVSSLLLTTYKPVNELMQSDSYYFANQVVNDWTLGFIVDITVLNATISPTCPNGYENAFNFNWRGTGFGCLCQGGSNTTFVLEAYCSPSLIQINCTNIGSQEARSTGYWKNSSNICVKRSSTSFANQKKYDGTNKICGSSQSLTIVPSSELCPIVNVSMSKFEIEDHIMTATDSLSLLPKIYASYNATSPYSFYSYPVSRFSVSEYQFCQINQDTGLSPSHVDFVLLTVPRGCLQEGNYTKIDETTELDFYNNNPKLKQLALIKGFPQPGNWIYKFGFSSSPSWTYRCRHNLNEKFSISQTTKQFSFQIYSFLETTFLVIMGAVVLIAVEVFILGLRRCINNSIYPVGYKQQYMPQHFWWSLSRYILDLLFKLLIIIMSAICSYNSFNDWHWYKQVQNNKCHHDNLDIITNILVPFQSVHFIILKSSVGVAIVTLVMLIVDISHFAYIYNNQLVHYLVEENQVLVDKDDFENKNGSLDRLNDLKWLEKDNVQQLEADKNDDALRVTMAQNMFGDDQVPQTASKLKKKKKKTSPAKKLFNREKKQGQVSGGGYLFQDQIFGNLDNIDQPTTTVVATSIPKKKVNNRRKR